ncbi:MAG: hypothetical protein NZ742_08640 [Acidobacteria bacterium]|nr:hypothetical protein [Acidobacteriota bacterium]MDW7984207.1 hypothetical protein [Acidobacteriota bacterium]
MTHFMTIEQFHSMLNSDMDHPMMALLRKLTEADPAVVRSVTGRMGAYMAYWY